jgi:hypothetical protein
MSDSNAYFPHGNDDADYWPIVVKRFQRLRAAALDQIAVIKAAPVVSAETATPGEPARSAGAS